MSKLKAIEKRAQQAILNYTIENYKQRRENWLNEPAIRKAIFVYSFFRIENAFLIAATILATGCFPLLLFPALGWSALAWLGALIPIVLGVVAELLYFFFSFRNGKVQARAVKDLFTVDFQPAHVEDKRLRHDVDQALEYWSLIDEAIQKVPKGVLRDRLTKTGQEVTHWLQAVYNLAERVDKFRNNKIIEQDLEKVPKSIEQYERKLVEEDSPEVRSQLERTIADKKRQLQTLESLEDHMDKASYQLDSTISSLGTIYSQLLLVGSKDEQGSRLNRLQEEISEQVYQLEDLTDAMDEVYGSSI